MFNKSIDRYVDTYNDTQLFESQPEETQTEIEKYVGLFRKYSNIVHDCFTLLNTETGDIMHLPFPGGLYDQPASTVRHLKTVQAAFKDHLKHLQEEAKKDAGRKGGKTRRSGYRE